mmetsp:Transcript_10878/g.32725  ORF Transcript_10878/g.32725 Transcript_10878/m.32725 type:complete len:108 (+) Transcript_10878:767-1090(+)
MARVYKISVAAKALVALLAKLAAARAANADTITRTILHAGALALFSGTSQADDPKLVQVAGYASPHEKQVRAAVARELGFRFLFVPPDFPAIRKRINAVVDKRLAAS